jgi:hypothetical protein
MVIDWQSRKALKVMLVMEPKDKHPLFGNGGRHVVCLLAHMVLCEGCFGWFKKLIIQKKFPYVISQGGFLQDLVAMNQLQKKTRSVHIIILMFSHWTIHVYLCLSQFAVVSLDWPLDCSADEYQMVNWLLLQWKIFKVL